MTTAGSSRFRSVPAPTGSSCSTPTRSGRTGSAGSSTPDLARRLVGPLLAVALLAAACSGGDETATDDPSTTTGPTSTTEPTPTEDGHDEPTEAGGATTTETPSVPTVADDADPDADDDDGSDPDADPGAATPPDEQPLPTTAEELTAAVDEAELALRAPGIDQETAAPWGRRQQALYRVLAFNPEWAETVLGGVDPSVADAVALNWTARQELLSLVNTEELSETLPAWRIVAPPPADELLGYYRESEETNGVPWEILAAINLVETRMGRIRGVSSAGALGPMQFLPTTWAECCDGDPTNPRDAINGAGRYLVQRGADDDLNRAIFGYNNSDYYVAAITSYAAVLETDPEAYYGYHAWQVYFLSAEGLIVLPEGYEQAEPIAAEEWLAANPETLFPR